jgi:tetrahydromethanopterin S-methyltransferase subunit G
MDRAERVYRAHAMADEPDNLALRMLRRIDEKLDRLIEDVQGLKVRMTNVEARLDRIERRLELVEGPV